MQAVTEIYPSQESVYTSNPSLLRQTMDIVDEMDEGEKKLLLLTLKKYNLSQKLKELDDKIARSEWIMNEEDIDKLVAETRREMYEERIRICVAEICGA